MLALLFPFLPICSQHSNNRLTLIVFLLRNFFSPLHSFHSPEKHISDFFFIFLLLVIQLVYVKPHSQLTYSPSTMKINGVELLRFKVNVKNENNMQSRFVNVLLGERLVPCAGRIQKTKVQKLAVKCLEYASCANKEFSRHEKSHPTISHRCVWCGEMVEKSPSSAQMDGLGM